jgi:hypothetical protein
MYLIFNHNSTFLAEHKNYKDAIQEQHFYIDQTGNDAYITLLSDLSKEEKQSYDKLKENV